MTVPPQIHLPETNNHTANLLAVSLLVCLTSCAAPPADGGQAVAAEEKETEEKQAKLPPYAERDEVRQFARELADEYDFDYDEVMEILANAEHRPRIIELMSRTPEGTWTWERYRNHFLDDQRIDGGVLFWRRYRDELAQAEEEYGVPAETIVAIIGVETRYGTVKGRTRILDALATLGFDYPRRSKFFLKELREFLLMQREEGLDPLELRGSYAGAMGWGQFMPSSYRAYAVDFDGDGVRDLLESPRDAIGSVANYLAVHKWKRDQIPVVPAAIVSEPEEDSLRFNRRRPCCLLQELAAYMVPQPQDADLFAADEKVIPLRLTMNDDAPPEYWIGRHNLYVITRYNTSLLYAMAVHTLGQTIREKLANP